MPGGLRRLATIVISTLLLAGCRGPAAHLDCVGQGEAEGRFEEVNSGRLQLTDAVAWSRQQAGWSVIFTDDAVLARALRDSPSPRDDGDLAAAMMGKLLVGFDFHPGGGIEQRFTLGSSRSNGRDAWDRGSIRIDGDGCARGSIELQYNGGGQFAVPLSQPQHWARLLYEDVETTPINTDSAASSLPTLPPTDPLSEWQALHEILQQAPAASALQVVGLSAPVAEHLAAHPAALAALQRLRGQCPDPAQSVLDEYGDLVGPAHPTPAMELRAHLPGDSLQLSRCYVTARNGESIEQCWPLQADCTR